MQIGPRWSCLTICGVGCGIQWYPTSVQLTGGWVLPLGQEGKDAILGVCFLPLWVILRLFPWAGALSEYHLMGSGGLGHLDWFPLIAGDGLLMNPCLCWLWQIPGRNRNLKEGDVTDLEGGPWLLSNSFLQRREPLIPTDVKGVKGRNTCVYCLAYW